MKATIKDLGDVHLGRKFTTGVPLDRMGDREKQVWNHFVSDIMECNTDLHVQVGDIFNQFAVPEALILDTARMYRQAAEINPGTTYVILRGNHDASRDTSKAASFDVLAELLSDVSNIHVLRDMEVLQVKDSAIGFLPWHPFKSAAELATSLKNYLNSQVSQDPPVLDMVYGHWDTGTFGGSDFNLIPTHILKDITKLVKTGHVHTPDRFKRDGVEVVVVGSMEPYSHAEDPEHHQYQTLKFEDYEALVASNTDLSWTNMRVLIQPGQVPTPTNCLSLITKVVKPDYQEGDEENLDVEFEEFDMEALFQSCLKNRNVGATIAATITDKFRELKNVQ